MPPILADEQTPDVVRVSHELADPLAPRPRVKDLDHSLGAAGCDDGPAGVGGERVNRGLLARDLGVVHDHERGRVGARDVPELDLAVEAARGDPGLLSTVGDDSKDQLRFEGTIGSILDPPMREAAYVVGVRPDDGRAHRRVGRMRVPCANGSIRRGRDQRPIQVAENDVVDPVRVVLNALSERRFRRLM